MFEICGQQKTLTQWDMGRKLTVHEVCDQVHFANSAMTEAIVCGVTVEGEARTVKIPDEVLQVSGTLWVYAFVRDGEAYTKHIQPFFVKAKPKPADYVYTPTQWITVEQIMERVETLENKQETDPTVPAWAKKSKKPTYTAAEVGARADTWMPTAAQVGARADTWLPSASEIGAAPGGYGLGYAKLVTVTELADLDGITAPGWYQFVLEGSTIANITSNYWFLHVSAYGDGSQHCVQEFYPVTASIYTKIIRRKRAGNWQDAEVENPPMAANTEYRTAERWGGKSVYIKRISIGTLPNTTNKLTSHGISGASFASVEVFATKSDGSLFQPFPIITTSGELRGKVQVTGTSVTVYTFSDLSAYTAYAIVRYTKD